MSYHIRVDHRDGRHVHFTIFVGKADNMTHANAGSLILNPEEFNDFLVRLRPTKVTYA